MRWACFSFFSLNFWAQIFPPRPRSVSSVQRLLKPNLLSLSISNFVNHKPNNVLSALLIFISNVFTVIIVKIPAGDGYSVEGRMKAEVKAVEDFKQQEKSTRSLYLFRAGGNTRVVLGNRKLDRLLIRLLLIDISLQKLFTKILILVYTFTINRNFA